jgi:signal peptidase
MRRRTVAGIGALLIVAVLVVPRLFGYRPYAVTGGSMAQAVPAGSLVLATAVDAAQLRRGDVATFVPAGHRERVTHRVVSTRGGIRTRGDANRAADPWTVDPRSPVHRVVADVPHAGRAIVAVQDHALTVLAVGLLALLVAGVPPASGPISRRRRRQAVPRSVTPRQPRGEESS